MGGQSAIYRTTSRCMNLTWQQSLVKNLPLSNCSKLLVPDELPHVACPRLVSLLPLGHPVSKVKVRFGSVLFELTFSADRCAWREQHPWQPESFLLTLSCLHRKGRDPAIQNYLGWKFILKLHISGLKTSVIVVTLSATSNLHMVWLASRAQ